MESGRLHATRGALPSLGTRSIFLNPRAHSGRAVPFAASGASTAPPLATTMPTRAATVPTSSQRYPFASATSASSQRYPFFGPTSATPSRNATHGGTSGYEAPRAGVCTKKGTHPSKRLNQDRSAVLWLGPHDLGALPAAFGVFDGHGPMGHAVANFLRAYLPPGIGSAIPAALQQCADEQRDTTASACTAETHPALVRAARAAHSRVANELVTSGIGVSHSGATACTAVLCRTERSGRCLVVCNVGDSRCVLGRRTGSPRGRALGMSCVGAIDLSVDHKPNHSSERARIEGAGGYVAPSRTPLGTFAGPPRVWDASRRLGLATSRSFGDSAYAMPNEGGVIATPELTLRVLAPEDLLIVIASDGVWDQLSSQEAIDVASTAVLAGSRPETAAEQIVKLASDRWHRDAPTQDDITALVVVF